MSVLGRHQEQKQVHSWWFGGIEQKKRQNVQKQWTWRLHAITASLACEIPQSGELNKFSKLSSELEFDKRTLKQSRNDLDILFWTMGGGDERCFMVGPGRLLWFASISPKPTGERALRKGVCVLKCNTCCPSVNFFCSHWHWVNFLFGKGVSFIVALG